MFTASFSSDCIGSAFNIKGAMECPNCREMENGLWQHFRNDNHEEITDEEEDNDEDYDEFEMVKTRSSLVLFFLFYLITSYSWY